MQFTQPTKYGSPHNLEQIETIPPTPFTNETTTICQIENIRIYAMYHSIEAPDITNPIMMCVITQVDAPKDQTWIIKNMNSNIRLIGTGPQTISLPPGEYELKAN